MPSPKELDRDPRCKTIPGLNRSPIRSLNQRRCRAVSEPGKVVAFTSIATTAPPGPPKDEVDLPVLPLLQLPDADRILADRPQLEKLGEHERLQEPAKGRMPHAAQVRNGNTEQMGQSRICYEDLRRLGQPLRQVGRPRGHLDGEENYVQVGEVVASRRPVQVSGAGQISHHTR